MILPRIYSIEEYRDVYGDAGIWLPAMNEIARRHSLAGEPQRQTLGSNVVYGFGELIVKLFAPLWANGFQTEKAALEAVRGLPVPEIVDEGALEGWPYLIVKRLHGIPVGDVWDELDSVQRRRIVYYLGDLMRAVHQCEIPAGLPDDWKTFLSERLSGAVDHHNVAEPWRDWIAEQLSDFREPPHQKVLLNGDLTHDHLLLSETKGEWSISGVIDFGDARIGHPFYEFAIPLLDYTYGSSELSHVLLDAYGLDPTTQVLASLTRYCLLHEFATLDDHLERCPAESPEHFCRLIWG